ncbi:MAG: AI-2E family transporter [Chlamydiia bacterium]|nr:AI-2E family transporter [Chlamydiia bacterium]
MSSSSLIKSSIGYTLAWITLLVLLFLLVVFYGEVLLIVFLSAILAIFLRAVSQPLRDWFKLPDTLSVLLGTAGLLVLFVMLWVNGLPEIFSQLNTLFKQLPAAWNQVSSYLEKYELFQGKLAPGQMIEYAQTALLRAGTLFSNVVGIFVSLFLMFFLAIFFSIHPSNYIDRIIRLVPKDYVERYEELFDRLHKILRRWIWGMVGSITTIGVLTYLGLTILGVESALVLSLLAAFFSIIPNFGPLLGLIPAALIALTQDPWLMLYVVILYTVIQALESNLITPLIQQRSTAQPPGLILFWQILMSAFAGLLGLILAAPFLCLLSTTVDVLYVEGVLGKTRDQKK